LSDWIQDDSLEPVLRMEGHDFMLKVFSSYLASGMTSDDHKNTPVRISILWAKFLNLRPHDYEAEVLTTLSPSLVK
jgi:hypothetical protein